MATVQELINSLKKIKDKSLPVIAICGSDGCSYPVGSAYLDTKEDGFDDSGELVDLPVGTKYVSLSIGN